MDANLTLWSMKDLREEFDEVVYERKLLFRKIRKEGKTTQEKEILDAINEWIDKLDTEIVRRLRLVN